MHSSARGRGCSSPGLLTARRRGICVGSDYTRRARNWPTFVRSPSEASIVRFDNKQTAEAELARVQSYAANARLREVE